MNLKIGAKAPDFKLQDQEGKVHKLSDYLGKKVLVYFYPRDNTPGCTKEACGIRDNFPAFEKLSAKVLGISTDTTQSHKKFRDKFNLPFTLLANPDKKVVKLYGVWKVKKFMGRQYFGTVRTSFLIDKEGQIIKIYKNVKPPAHAKEVLSDMSTVENS